MEVIIISGMATLVLATLQFVGHLAVARRVLIAADYPCLPKAPESSTPDDYHVRPGEGILDEAA
jgi:hypothetical protein